MDTEKLKANRIVGKVDFNHSVSFSVETQKCLTETKVLIGDVVYNVDAVVAAGQLAGMLVVSRLEDRPFVDGQNWQAKTIYLVDPNRAEVLQGSLTFENKATKELHWHACLEQPY